MSAQPAEPGIQLASQVEDLTGVRGQGLLGPAVGDRSQQGDQGTRRCQDHPSSRRIVEQRRVRLQRVREERLARHEQHHELGGCRQQAPVRLGCQGIDVRANLLGMGGQQLIPPTVGLAGPLLASLRLAELSVPLRCGVRLAGRLPGRLGGGGDRCRVQERAQRNLGVDHDVFAAREVYHHVRALDRIRVAGPVDRGVLVGDVAAIPQPGQLGGPGQVQLPPASADLRFSQSRCERVGFGAERLTGQPNRFHLLLQRALQRNPGALHLPQSVVQVIKALLDRGEHGLGAGIGEVEQLTPGLRDRVRAQRFDLIRDRRLAHYPATHPEHAERDTDAGSDQGAGQEDQQLHGPSISGATDNRGRAVGGPRIGQQGRARVGRSLPSGRHCGNATTDLPSCCLCSSRVVAKRSFPPAGFELDVCSFSDGSCVCGVNLGAAWDPDPGFSECDAHLLYVVRAPRNSGSARRCGVRRSDRDVGRPAHDSERGSAARPVARPVP